MGFLTEVEPDQATAVLERMLDGSARIEERLAVVAEAFVVRTAVGPQRGHRREERPAPADPARGVRGRRVRITFSADG